MYKKTLHIWSETVSTTPKIKKGKNDIKKERKYKMKTKNSLLLLLCFLNIFTLSACSSTDIEGQTINSIQTMSDAVYSSVTSTNNFSDEASDNTEINLSETEETPPQTTSVLSE